MLSGHPHLRSPLTISGGAGKETMSVYPFPVLSLMAFKALL